MISVIQCASFFYSRYNCENDCEIDEMKLHKLLYFAQRESFIRNDKELFPETLRAWRFGPVSIEIRELFLTSRQASLLDRTLAISDEKDYATLDYVYSNYAQRDSWSLSRLSHGETSWKKARVGFTDYENSNVLIQNSDIREDAQRIRLRRKLLGYAY